MKMWWDLVKVVVQKESNYINKIIYNPDTLVTLLWVIMAMFFQIHNLTMIP